MIRKARARLKIRTRAKGFVRELRAMAASKGQAPPIVVKDDSGATAVDTYWNKHTVHYRIGRFASAAESERYLARRNATYPMFPELMDLYGDHAGQTVMDYGCGPGDDTTGFLLYSKAARVVAMDVSHNALGLLSHRLAVHRIDLDRVELVQINDSVARIPLPDESIDYIHCCGVLHHTTHPGEILKEFQRVMKPGAEGRLMLYNRDSVMYHVWIAYAQLIVNRAFPGLSVDEAFTKSTDGPDCPVSDAWAPQRVIDTANAAGLGCEFRGGYLSVWELEWLSEYGDDARTDERLGAEHRAFANELTFDEAGLPRWHGMYAGIGGVYRITKAI